MTKARRFQREEEQARARAKPRRKAKARRTVRAKAHNVSNRAAKNAVVEIEDSPVGVRPPRKSTRKSANRHKSAETLEVRRQIRASSPQMKNGMGKKRNERRAPKSRRAAPRPSRAS